MKALVWEAARTMTLRDEPEPRAAADEIVVRVGHAGICGSELSGYLGHNALRVPPLIMGHEFAGEIVDLGALVPAFQPDLKLGALVTVNPLWYCGDCALCAAGLNQLCVNRRLLGAHRPGASAEYICAPAKLSPPLPAGMDPPLGALTRLAMGEALGGIPIQPSAVDTVATVREATAGAGVAVSIDAVGTALTREQCVAATKASGRLILSGLHEESSAMPVAAMIRSEITAVGSFAYTPANFARALDLLGAGALRLDPWIHEAPLAEGGDWFERLIEAPGDVSKVLLTP